MAESRNNKKKSGRLTDRLRRSSKWEKGIMLLVLIGLLGAGIYSLLVETGEIEVEKNFEGGQYTGRWRWGHPGGEGVLQIDTTTIAGNWVDGKLPYGTITTPHLVYRGNIRDNRPDGYGSCHYTSGARYYGMWKEGEESGLGRFDYADGKIDFGIWDNGRLIVPPGQDFTVGNRVYGLDISIHQPDVDWNDLALYCDSLGQYTEGKTPYLQPVYFVILKSTEGTTIQDRLYDQRRAEAKAHGVYTGAYHFLTNMSPIETQIKNFIANTHLGPGDLPPILDIELPNKVMRRNRKKVIADAHRWLEAMEQHYGVRPILYTYNSFYLSYLKDAGFDDYELWIARYGVDQLPDINHWIIWQFTEKGDIQGINRTVDINRFKGSFRDFRNWVDTLQWKK
ncbi:MAG: hypothetical protein NC336_10400 [Clostridium sp.]|nr:hypothetical protein [Clostridium sp.]